MNAIKEIVLSFKQIIPDVLMLLVSLVGSILLLIFSPLIHLVNLYKTKNFPKPRVIVISGASSGIGRSLAVKYAEDRVVLGLIGRDSNRLNEAKSECLKKAPGCRVEIVSLDVSNQKAMKDWLIGFDDRHPIDLIIANAGVSDLTLPNDLSYEEKVLEVMNINANGCFYSVLPLLPRFRSRRHGQICIVSSLSAYLNIVYPAYTASKACVTAWGLTLRQELQHYGIGVTVVAPGFVYTGMSDALGAEKLQFAISSDEAAVTISEGINENRAYVGFNLPTFLITYLASVIPPNFRGAIYPLFSGQIPSPPDTIMFTSSKSQIEHSTQKQLNEDLFIKSEQIKSKQSSSKKR